MRRYMSLSTARSFSRENPTSYSAAHAVSRLTYATNYYFDISDRSLFLHHELSILVFREPVMQKVLINHFDEVKI